MANELNMPVTYSTGWIYVLENEAMPSLIKIGFTKNRLEQRISELSNVTGVPHPFSCAYRCNVRNPETVEAEIHSALATYRTNNDREFFSAKLELAIITIREIASKQIGGLNDE